MTTNKARAKVNVQLTVTVPCPAQDPISSNFAFAGFVAVIGPLKQKYGERGKQKTTGRNGGRNEVRKEGGKQESK